MEVTRRELTAVEAAAWCEANPHVSEAELTDPDGTVIGFMARGPGWRLVWTPGQGGTVTLLTAGLPR
jgi:hypothetical protein